MKFEVKNKLGEVIQTFEVNSGPQVIGRSNAESVIKIKSSGLSREHAIIEVEESTCFITDLGSTNGTFVNGKKLAEHKKTEIGPNSPARLGNDITLYPLIVSNFDQADLSAPAIPNLNSTVGFNLGEKTLSNDKTVSKNSHEDFNLTMISQPTNSIVNTQIANKEDIFFGDTLKSKNSILKNASNKPKEKTYDSLKRNDSELDLYAITLFSALFIYFLIIMTEHLM